MNIRIREALKNLLEEEGTCYAFFKEFKMSQKKENGRKEKK